MEKRIEKQMEKIDALGKACPTPVILAKKALENPENSGIFIQIDNETALNNLKRLAESLSCSYSYEEKSSVENQGALLFEVKIEKNTESLNKAMNVSNYAGTVGNKNVGNKAGSINSAVGDQDGTSGRSIPSIGESAEGNPAASVVAADKAPNTILFTKDTMGDGSEELGKILIKGFIYALTELSPPPKALLFVNGGVMLAQNGANTVQDLKTLEEGGTEIIICGTCANYFNIKDDLAVGTIGDMYTIAGKMAEGRLISL